MFNYAYLSRQQQTSRTATSLKWFARSFFVAAGLLGIAVLVYFSSPPSTTSPSTGGVYTQGVVGEFNNNNNNGGRVGPLLPPRPAHGGHAGHSHAHGGIKGDSTPQTFVQENAEPAERRVERRTFSRDGDNVDEETTYYGAASALTAEEREAIGSAADQAAEEGAEVVVIRRFVRRPEREKKSKRVKGGGDEGNKATTPEQQQPPPPPPPAGQQQPQQGSTVVVVQPPPPPPPPAPVVTTTVEWKPMVIPTRDPNWVEAQRPIPGERDVTSHTFQELTQHSLNPPPYDYMDASKTPNLTDAERQELAHRLVVAIALGVHHGGIRPGENPEGLRAMPLVKVLLSTLLPTAQPHHIYRFYFAYDHNDPVFEQESWRNAIDAIFATAFAEEDAKRWHPEGYTPKSPIDGSRLVYSLHWVHCDFSGKPSWAHSDAVVAAYKEGADYTYRSNDDSRFPAIGDWADRFIINLRTRTPVPNLGVVGPTCHEGANWILTHDFTHRTHVVVFGFQYPRGLPDWSSDDWITYIYGGFGLMKKLEETLVSHTLMLGTRYNPMAQGPRLATLNSELQRGSEILDKWVSETKNVKIPYTVKHVECC